MRYPSVCLPLKDFLSLYGSFIGKYLSSLRKLDHVIAPKEGFETHLGASYLPITFGMCTLGMTRQIRDGRLQRGVDTHGLTPVAL